jgi:imidazoleglycerol-phosphate dehydratase
VRSAALRRDTTESNVRVELSLDTFEKARITTGVLMFDHLLAQFAFHARCGLAIEASSLDGLQHHVVEDVAIVLGRALDGALGERTAIKRYGEATIPMDDALVRAAVDFGGRAFSRIALPLGCERIEDLGAPIVAHAFSTFAQNARIAVHLDLLAGTDPHHIVEGAFKALARACTRAWSIDQLMPSLVPSTKGLL